MTPCSSLGAYIFQTTWKSHFLGCAITGRLAFHGKSEVFQGFGIFSKKSVKNQPLTIGFWWAFVDQSRLEKHWRLKIGSQPLTNPMGKSRNPAEKSMNACSTRSSTPKNTNAYAEKKDLSIWTRQVCWQLASWRRRKLWSWLDLIGLDEEFETPSLPYLPWHLKTTASLLTKWHTNSKDTLY